MKTIAAWGIHVGMAAVASLAAAEEIPPVLPIGSNAPPFSLKGIDGSTHTLDDYAGAKLLCLIFTSNHCPDSVAAATRMEALYQDYKDRGVALVAVSSNHHESLRPDELGYSVYGDSFEEMAPFAKENGWTFDYLYDADDQKLATACGAQSTPHVFLFDADRTLRYTGRMDDAGRKKGPVEKSYVRRALDELLAGKEVGEPVTRSFGCSTKWLFKKASVRQDQEHWEKRPVTVADLDRELAERLRKNGSENFRLINFWSTTCGPCVAEFPSLVDTYRRFQSRAFEFVSISLDPKEDRSKVEKFLSSRHAALSDHTRPALEKDQRASNNYHWTGGNPDTLAEAIDSEWTGALPHTVLVSPDGAILWRHNGEIQPVELRRQILKALDEAGLP